jgi:hypothetical protein
VFSDPGNVLERGFLVGYLAPAAIFLAGALGILAPRAGIPINLGLDGSNGWVGGTVGILLIAWITGLVLAAANRMVVRWQAGYFWDALTARARAYPELTAVSQVLELRYRPSRAAFQRINEQHDRLRAERDTLPRDEVFPPGKAVALRRLALVKADRFPSRETLLLPTPLGNVIRAIEEYTQKLYGCDASVTWYRLAGLIDAPVRAELKAARATLNFWLNLKLLSALYAAACLGLIGAGRGDAWAWASGLAAALLWLLARVLAVPNAVHYGHWVKASFDLYLPRLAVALGYRAPRQVHEDKTLWNKLNRVFTYGLTDARIDIDRFRAGTREGGAAPSSDERRPG